jgi:hypothetical protein
MKKMNEDQLRQKMFENDWNLMQSRPEIKELYPKIDLIKMELAFNYSGAYTVNKQDYIEYKPFDKMFFKIKCANPECVFSDLDLSSEIFTMYHNNENIKEGKKICNGAQDYKRYRSKGTSCLCTMQYKIQIEYKK